MTDDTLTFETSHNEPMEEDKVLETVNSAAFPTSFTSASYDVMVVVDTTLLSTKAYVLEALERIKKSIMQSVNFTG